LFGSAGGVASSCNNPSSPTYFNAKLYETLLTLFQLSSKGHPELLKVFGEDFIQFILLTSSDSMKYKAHQPFEGKNPEMKPNL